MYDAVIARIGQIQAAIWRRCHVAGSVEGQLAAQADHPQRLKADSSPGVGVNFGLLWFRTDAKFPDLCRHIFFNEHAGVVGWGPGCQGQGRIVECQGIVSVIAVKPQLPQS